MNTYVASGNLIWFDAETIEEARNQLIERSLHGTFTFTIENEDDPDETLEAEI